MEWSPSSATEAYFSTIRLCRNGKRPCNSMRMREPESKEFIAALAAGMNAKLIVEVTLNVSPLTIALAAAARQTGGHFVCILPESTVNESKLVIEDSDLGDNVEFVAGDPFELLPNYENIDFALIDCRADNHVRLLRLLEVNPRRAVVVANNLVAGRPGLCGHVKGMKDEVAVRSLKHVIGKGMEISVIGSRDQSMKKGDWFGSWTLRGEKRGSWSKRPDKSRWVRKVDEESGEEHIFRIPSTS